MKKFPKIEVTVNFPNDEDKDLVFENTSLDDVALAVANSWPNYASIVLIMVKP